MSIEKPIINNCESEKKESSLKEMLIESGIADVMIDILNENKAKSDPEIMLSARDCDFEVSKIFDTDSGEGNGKGKMYRALVIKSKELDQDSGGLILDQSFSVDKSAEGLCSTLNDQQRLVIKKIFQDTETTEVID